MMSGSCSADGGHAERAARSSGPTWFGRHLHLLLMSLAAVIAGGVSGFWPLSPCAVSYELLHQCSAFRKWNRYDWRSSDLALSIATGLSIVTGLLASSMLSQRNPRPSVLVLGVYLISQFVASHGWNALAYLRGTDERRRKRVIRNAFNIIGGVAGMAYAVWLIRS